MGIDKSSIATPSSDGSTYFEHPYGTILPPAGGYTELRATSGSEGETASISGAGVIDGAFDWSATDPNGNGDDGGIVFTSAGGGFWLRRFTYNTTSPIELDWYEPTQGGEVTSIFESLATSHAPNFWLRTPTTKTDVYLDYVDLSGRITDFRLFSGGAGAELLQKTNPATELGEYRMIRIYGYVRAVMEAGVIFRGQYALFVQPGSSTEQPSGYYRDGSSGTGGFRSYPTVEFESVDSVSISVVSHADFIDTPARGLASKGIYDTADWTVGGLYDNSGFYCGKGIKNLYFDDVVFEDPLGGTVGQGINFENYFEKWHGAYIGYVFGKTSGQMTLRYGGARFFASQCRDLGNSKLDPLLVTLDMNGYKPNGDPFGQPSGMRTNAVKFDMLKASNGPGTRFLKIIDNDNCDQNVGYVLEVDETSTAADNYITDLHTELVNVGGNFDGAYLGVNTSQYTERAVQNCEFTGTVQTATLVHQGPNLFYDYTCENMYISRYRDSTDLSSSRPDSITMTDCEFTGVLNIRAGQGHVATNLTLSIGDSVDFAPMAGEDPIDLTITGLTAPSGTRIVQTTAGTCTLVIDGDDKLLSQANPYTVP